MTKNILHYFAGGNTAHGFHNLFESNLQGLDRLFILKGGPGTGKSTLMKKVATKWSEKGFHIEMVHCSSDPDSLDAVVIKELKVGIVDGTSPHVVEPKAPGAIEEYVNLGVAWDSKQLSEQKELILTLTHQISTSFQNAYNTFEKALIVHDQWEKIYIGNMDFTKANQLTEKLMKKLFDNRKVDRKADIKHRFLGAATPKGAVDFLPNITEGLTKRYFIKGRAGSGKSTMLKKIAAMGEEKGFDLEMYHCGFDPHSIDMVVVRELGFAIFDSTAPHEYFPEKETDEMIDMYAQTIVPGTDEKYADEIQIVSSKYKSYMKEGTAYLAKAKSVHDELEAIYMKAMDFSIIEQIRKDIEDKIAELEH
ncbi:molybdopterin-guanine dinucleotide biosynthesis protein [Oikeobacillus pervagus]|uniref:Molybdopterin-guanine dinucleotide biosynthesis protein n=1 Tax=Oikeobacillus pervagus TaxID=1325931 RepID=A0AAJ1WJ49_9BACI|nr:PRK06851 family protein [Oikeobacillus pervagus]MDQ0215325.1 molybdopterin-guanine dinucleotide biosynthesis protein [Oikeobacillus pervagus]